MAWAEHRSDDDPAEGRGAVALRRRIQLFRSSLPLVLATGLLAAAAGYFVSAAQPKTYEAQATLIVGQSLSALNPDYNEILTAQRLSRTYATIATTTPILAQVIA